jgi:hypothetical protein
MPLEKIANQFPSQSPYQTYGLSPGSRSAPLKMYIACLEEHLTEWREKRAPRLAPYTHCPVHCSLQGRRNEEQYFIEP